MTPEAWAIIRRQPRTSPYIFPYNPRSIQAAFTRACQMLGIVDYHFHDNRHEGKRNAITHGFWVARCVRLRQRAEGACPLPQLASAASQAPSPLAPSLDLR